ncbi:LysR substrate-binding domain-containing protein [Psychromarinibacter sp. C21-152]|uniref:LysR substrate-binding domain-containing protein n=1 Tax=Psychromarinibacter sediminicola TaxID=3033385 RepID=A0AAE3NTG4_9RHOB|nr:LysR substrate-binding domain-containing protein [Psychromarinibacter sediminicola]MDF0600600.1 LysR substrate-binding domain-containing protein [Psychromarinibacter sediminicola]
MTLDQLRAFVAVAERAHVTRAARAIGRTQSATSAAISALERQSGVQLFDRVGRGIELTEAGRRFLPEARRVLEQARVARAVLEQASGTVTGRVSVGASQTIANHWLPRRLAAYSAAYPGIRLNITIGNTQTVESAVLDGTVDIGLVEGPTGPGALTRQVVDTDRPMLVVSGRGPVPLPAGGRIDLQALPWVLREPGSGTRHVLEELCEREGIDFETLRIVLVLPSNEAVCEAVEAGAGATVISEQVAAAAVAEGRLRAVPVALPERDYVLIRHAERTPTAAQRALVAALAGG